MHVKRIYYVAQKQERARSKMKKQISDQNTWKRIKGETTATRVEKKIIFCRSFGVQMVKYVFALQGMNGILRCIY